jgi:four helix bundle protein
MTYSFPFEKLEVWKNAKEFVIEIYSVTKDFPVNEQYGLASQIKRAAVSIASNLAEGTSRSSLKDQAHFSQLAFSSLMEVACQSIIARDLGFISEEKYQFLRQGIELLSKQLNALRSSQIKRANK